MNKEKIYKRLEAYCDKVPGICCSSACKIYQHNPMHSCGVMNDYNIYRPFPHIPSWPEVLKNYKIVFGEDLTSLIVKREDMRSQSLTFKEVKQRSDYKFILNGIENLIKDIRSNCMKDLYENGDGHIGVAVLEIGYIDIEVNVYTYAQCVIGADSCDQRPLISYFVCIKRGESKDDWESDGYLDYDPNVDWMADDWKKQLEKDMFEALNEYVNNTEYSYNKPN